MTIILPDSKDAEEVSIAVQAFLTADMPNELISLLEKIVLKTSEFSNYKKLQNLLLITSMKYEPHKVKDYINRLDNYEEEEIAEICLNDKYQLYEEAFIIYSKIGKNSLAIDVLQDKL